MTRIPPLRVRSAGRRAAWAAGLGLLVFAGLSFARTTDLVEGLELTAVDLRTRQAAGRRAPDPRIVVMQVEESDVAWVQEHLAQPWPWPLEFNAGIVQVLEQAGARALLVDVLHLDRGAGPDDLPPGRALGDAELQRRAMEAADAETYGAALAAFGRAAVGFELSEAPRYDVAARRAQALGRLGTGDLDAPPQALERRGAEWPVLGVARGAARLGFVNASPDLDGVVRRAAVLGRYRLDDRTVLSLALAGASLASGAEPTLEGDAVRLGAARQRLMEDASFLLDYRSRSPRGAYPRVAPAEALAWAQRLAADGALPDEARARLAGRIVVFGVNLPGLKDLVACPLGGTLDGPVHQATALDDLLHGDGRVRADASTNAAILLALILCLAVLGALPRGGLVPHVLPVGAAAGTVVLAFLAFARGTSYDLVTPVLGILLTWIATTALRLLTEGRRNRWLEATFGHYMAPAIIEHLKRDPGLLELGGRERDITVLFSDVAGFTGLSTHLAPAQVVALLNRYLTDHCAAVLDEGGVVDKFQGDGVMAFFGDPVPEPDHALRACRAALRVLEALPALEPTWRAMGLDRFHVRIGLNTGPAVVGNMGSEQRFDYTCMGDTVNTASRLEGACKAFDVALLVGPRTAAAVEDAVILKPLGAIVVVGRTEPLVAHEALGLAAQAAPALVAHAQAFARAFQHARADDLDAATAALEEARRLRPGDGPCAWLVGVLAALRDGRIARPWTGITVLDRK